MFAFKIHAMRNCECHDFKQQTNYFKSALTENVALKANLHARYVLSMRCCSNYYCGLYLNSISKWIYIRTELFGRLILVSFENLQLKLVTCPAWVCEICLPLEVHKKSIWLQLQTLIGNSNHIPRYMFLTLHEP